MLRASCSDRSQDIALAEPERFTVAENQKPSVTQNESFTVGETFTPSHGGPPASLPRNNFRSRSEGEDLHDRGQGEIARLQGHGQKRPLESRCGRNDERRGRE